MTKSEETNAGLVDQRPPEEEVKDGKVVPWVNRGLVAGKTNAPKPKKGKPDEQ